jgi:predicted transcriptional regulator
MKRLRRISGISQFSLARQAGISRARISLCELGELTLSPEERSRIRCILLSAIDARVKQLLAILAEERFVGHEADQ